jgi:Domain of unknown function (DUF4386)
VTPLATRRAAGAFLLVVPLGFSICFSLLQQLFAYPAILRQPAPDVLTQFAAGGPTLVGVWYALTLTALAFVPLTVLVQRVLSERSASPLIGLAAAFGVTAGLVQTLGFVRWPFLVPFLAQSYLTPEATEMQRVTAIGLFDAFNHYGGAGVGEHLGYLTTAVWTLLTAVVMVRTGLLSRWLGIAGGVLGVGIAAGLVEPAGWELGGAINAISYLLWAVWLLVLGVILLRGRSSTQLAPSMLETASAAV